MCVAGPGHVTLCNASGLKHRGVGLGLGVARGWVRAQGRLSHNNGMDKGHNVDEG